MSSITLINQILNNPKTHKPERAVKSLLANSFYLDGNLFIERFDQVYLTDSMEIQSFRAKAVVDLAMSIECSLKSLIISLSRDDELPKLAYQKARSSNHDLNKLHEEVKKRAKNRFKLPKKNSLVFESLIKLGIGSRYSHEIWLLRINKAAGSYFVGDDLISNTIDDLKWGKSVRKEAVAFNNLASNCNNKYLKKHSILTGGRFSSYHLALEKFLKSK